MNKEKRKIFEEEIKNMGKNDLIYFNHLIVERLKLLSQADYLRCMADFNVGETVSFPGPDGKEMVGMIFRLNKKTISVRTSEDSYWNIPPQMLKHYDE